MYESRFEASYLHIKRILLQKISLLREVLHLKFFYAYSTETLHIFLFYKHDVTNLCLPKKLLNHYLTKKSLHLNIYIMMSSKQTVPSKHKT